MTEADTSISLYVPKTYQICVTQWRSETQLQMRLKRDLNKMAFIKCIIMKNESYFFDV